LLLFSGVLVDVVTIIIHSVRTDPGKAWKVLEFNLEILRPWKAWKMIIGMEKSGKNP